MDAIIVGDNYPFVVKLKRNGMSVDISNGQVFFKYKSRQDNLKTIKGISANPTVGEVVFIPSSTDFTEVGSFVYDIVYIDDEIKMTLEQGTFEILDSVETVKI
jgi:hypothetical protein